MNNEVFAKSNGISLKTHSLDTLKIMNIIIKANLKLLNNRLNLLGINSEEFISNLRICALFHDFGKSSNLWQSKNQMLMSGNKIKLPPHAVYSGFFFMPKSTMDFISLLTIISHHSLLTENSFQNINYNMAFNENYLKDILQENELIYAKFPSLNTYFRELNKFKDKTPNSKDLYNNQINLLFKTKYCLS
ncbi:CRISPR-associated endonuclease Cas3'', partial [uncultured Methanobrevibacter sp.]|uniref:CRISPR-associated endonuclease Cas3'' n=1 Tax=uncultured Methanobrevibacter sp. TaxID=253161 RepID=UPI00260A8E07